MPVTDPDFHWPTKEDYDLAMENMNETMLDPVLQGGQLVNRHTGILHIGSADHTSLYKIQDDRGDVWMVRCFCEADPLSGFSDKAEAPGSPQDILQRYEKICNFCTTRSSETSALLPIHYVEQGIKVRYFERDLLGLPGLHKKTEELPLIRMPFVQGQSLGLFIASRCSQSKEYQDRQALSLLADAWQEMTHNLEAMEVAHGDLDLTNVIVTSRASSSRPVLKLIDYDNVWIPALADCEQNEQGHEAFQHPDFFWSNARPYDAQMDRFSALVIYISIRALAADPGLYKDGADENNRLLFAPSDYQAEKKRGSHSRIDELLSRNIPGLAPYLEELRYSLRNSCMPRSLDEIQAGETGLRSPGKAPKPQRIDEPDPDPLETIDDEPVRPIEIWEFRSVDWENAVYYKDKDAPLIEDIAPPPIKSTSNWPPRPKASSENNVSEAPSSRPSAPSQAQHPSDQPSAQSQSPQMRPQPPGSKRETPPAQSWSSTGRSHLLQSPPPPEWLPSSLKRNQKPEPVVSSQQLTKIAPRQPEQPFIQPTHKIASGNRYTHSDNPSHVLREPQRSSSATTTWIGCITISLLLILFIYIFSHFVLHIM